MKKNLWMLLITFLLAALLSAGSAWAKSENGQGADKNKDKKPGYSQNTSVNNEPNNSGKADGNGSYGNSNGNAGKNNNGNGNGNSGNTYNGNGHSSYVFSGNVNNAFSDASQHWAAASITRMTGKGFFRGYPDGTFRPDQPMTQAEAVSLVMKLHGNKNGQSNQGTQQFTDDPTLADVPAWARDAAGKAVQTGIIKLNRFHSEMQCSRAQIAVMLAKALGLEPVDTSNITFKDGIKISPEDVGCIMALFREGIIAGDSNGNFNPNSAVTRAQMACMLENALKKQTIISVSLPATAQVEAGKSTTLEAVVKYADGTTDKNVTWSSSDTSLATVANGVVTAAAGKTGTVTVTATATRGECTKSATCTVTIVAGTASGKQVKSVSLPATAQVEAGKSITLEAVVNYADGTTDKNVTWSSSDTSLATVNNGVVAAAAGRTGTVTITATTVSDGTKSAACVVTIVAGTP